LALSLLMSEQAGEAAGTLAGAAADPAMPRRARHDLALALGAAARRAEAIDVLQADNPAPEEGALAAEFATFARRLAGPEASRPPLC
jgi:Flp pilus assembly protein TadD